MKKRIPKKQLMEIYVLVTFIICLVIITIIISELLKPAVNTFNNILEEPNSNNYKLSTPFERIEISSGIPIQTKAQTETTVPISTKKEPIYVKLNVKNKLQKPYLPNGCEVVSLSIVLNYVGYDISPITLYDKFMPKSSYPKGDPWKTFVGDAKGVGYGCYAPCVEETGNCFLSSVNSDKKVYDVSGYPLYYYEKCIDNGMPVIMWGTIEMNGNASVCWEYRINGKKVNWHTYSHCLVLIGYTDSTYIFCDPLQGVVEYTKEATEESFEIDYRQACIVK